MNWHRVASLFSKYFAAAWLRLGIEKTRMIQVWCLHKKMKKNKKQKKTPSFSNNSQVCLVERAGNFNWFILFQPAAHNNRDGRPRVSQAATSQLKMSASRLLQIFRCDHRQLQYGQGSLSGTRRTNAVWYQGYFQNKTHPFWNEGPAARLPTERSPGELFVRRLFVRHRGQIWVL